jgi:hypothetical protein
MKNSTAVFLKSVHSMSLHFDSGGVQCAICGGGAAKSEILDASWCTPKESRKCTQSPAPFSVRRYRSPPGSNLEMDTGYFENMSMTSNRRPTYTCDATYVGIPGLQEHSFESSAMISESIAAASNANQGKFLYPDTDSSQLMWTYKNSDDLQRPYLQDATYLQHWGLSYTPSLSCKDQDAADIDAHNAGGRLLPTTGSCYVNQPPYWVEECHYSNVRITSTCSHIALCQFIPMSSIACR